MLDSVRRRRAVQRCCSGERRGRGGRAAARAASQSFEWCVMAHLGLEQVRSPSQKFASSDPALGRSNAAHHLRARARWRVSRSPELAVGAYRGMGAKHGAGPPQNARRRGWRARPRCAHDAPPCFAKDPQLRWGAGRHVAKPPRTVRRVMGRTFMFAFLVLCAQRAQTAAKVRVMFRCNTYHCGAKVEGHHVYLPYTLEPAPLIEQLRYLVWASTFVLKDLVQAKRPSTPSEPPAGSSAFNLWPAENDDGSVATEDPDYTQCGIMHLNAAKALEIGCRCQLGTLHQDADAQQLLASCI